MKTIAKPKPPERLVKLSEEVWKIQEEYAGKAMPEKVGEEFEAKAKEAQELQEKYDAEVGRWEQGQRIRRFEAEVPNPIEPASKPEEKDDSGDVAGYLTLGEAVVRSQEFQAFAKRNFPRGDFHMLSIPALSKHGLVPLTREQRKEYSQLDIKATPTLGAGVIEPQRVADFVRVTEDDETVLRDVLNVSRTNSSSVEYLQEDSYTRAAASVAAEAEKPEAGLYYSIQSASVRTIAVWIPVTTQMLADWPMIRNLIDSRLLYDLRKEEEEQVMYGAGAGQDFTGILATAGVTDISGLGRYAAGDPTTDKIRMGITEVRVAGYSPNALVIHPLDWEEVVLTKGTDDHYLAQVFPTQDGGFRVWGLNVVESVATEATAGNATEERHLIVGDWRRGATLWVREEASVQVGMANDDFITNMRTILAEERAAFAVQAPAAFAELETQVAVP
ncbi:MAG: phage major capsid protein [Gemmatimonadota bacterium]